MPDLKVEFIVFAIFVIVIVRYLWNRWTGATTGSGAGDSMPGSDGDGGSDGGGGDGGGGD